MDTLNLDQNIRDMATRCGAVAYTPPPLRAVRGYSFTYEALDAFVKTMTNSPVLGDWISADDVHRHVKDLDVALNGSGAAERPLLIDVLSQVRRESARRGKPLMQCLQQGDPAGMTGATPEALELTDEQADAIANACYDRLRTFTNYSGGMGGETWDRALIRFALTRPRQPSSEAVAIPDDVRKYAKAMKKDGYRGPLAWASKIIDFVADYAAPPAPQEPVAWIPPEREGEWHGSDAVTAYRTERAGWQPLCKCAPQEAREPLTEAQRKQIVAMWSRENRNYTVGDIIDAVEVAHRITASANGKLG